MNSESASSFVERLKVAASRVGGSDELARRAAIKRSTWGDYLGGKTEPRRPQLVAIALAAGVRTEWLAEGIEPIDREAPGSDAQGMQAVAVLPRQVGTSGLPGERFTILPRYDVRAGAGNGALVHSEQIVDYLAFDTDWLRRRIRIDARFLALIEAVGDSMKDTINDGDLLLLDLRADHVVDDGIYAFRVVDELSVKRLQRRQAGLRIISDNRAYEPEDLSPADAEKLQIVGRVVWHGGVM